MNQRNKKRKAFTLVEIMAVVIILSLLIGLVFPKLTSQMDVAKDRLVCIQLKSIETTLENYYVKNSRYPTNEEGLEELKAQNYIKKIPKDPWGTQISYLYENGKYKLYSFGSDKMEDGEKKDIYLIECE
ncbi:type II secretion system major pseudopilin GspG [bacterium]|jgi:general secretion pathway protein G|nr:type II secretion system major pseudopilin GspG [bacterium]